jgi:basic membrane protein A
VFTLASVVAIPAASLFLAGCPSNNSGGGGTGTTATTASPEAGASTSGSPVAASNIKAGLVTDVGGINDKSFNASAWDGLQRAGKELGIQVKYTESKQNADYVSNLTQYARSGYDVVFALGFRMQDALKDVAPRYPKVKFAIIDGDAPDLPNCASYKFREEQGSYLAGALAGAMTKSNKVGFIGGGADALDPKVRSRLHSGCQGNQSQGAGRDRLCAIFHRCC